MTFPDLEIHGVDGNLVEHEGAKSVAGEIFFRGGSGNLVRIKPGASFRGRVEILGSGNLVEIGEKAAIKGELVVKGEGQKVAIGAHTTSISLYLLCQEQCDVFIGAHCMFSREIEIRTTDAHSVIDRQTGRRVNEAASIRVGDHVWVGVGAVLSKGAEIAPDSIVGAGAFVNRRFEEGGVILAGLPARIVRRGVTWSRERKDLFTEAEMTAWKA